MLKPLAFLTLAICSIASADPGFSFKDERGDHLDVLLDEKIAARYMYAHDTSTPERRAITYKPYLHVFDAEGTEPITKGPGGEYTHHRGIFIGWNKITYDGKPYDRWHMIGKNPGEIVHQSFSKQEASADSASFTSITHWNDEAGKPMLVEERTMTFHRAPEPARLMIDFATVLTSNGEIELAGDPEHAGVHFRPSDTVDRAKTLYVYPVENPQPHKDLDYPWVGETFTLKNNKTYSVVEMIHPDDPKGAHWSAYRNYGRFGTFIRHKLKSGESLKLKYRFLIADGQMPDIGLIEKTFDQFAGAASPTEVPKVTVLPAEGSKSGKPKAPAAPKGESGK